MARLHLLRAFKKKLASFRKSLQVHSIHFSHRRSTEKKKQKKTLPEEEEHEVKKVTIEKPNQAPPLPKPTSPPKRHHSMDKEKKTDEEGEEDSTEYLSCCVCFQLYPLNKMDTHLMECKQKRTSVLEPLVHCPICFRLFSTKKIEKHSQWCTGIRRICFICGEYVPLVEVKEHEASCQQRLPELQQQEEEDKKNIQLSRQSLTVLNETQKKALAYVQQIAQRESELKYPVLLERFQRLGFNEECMKRTLKYIWNEAPIIIHVNLDKVLRHLVKDTHYRNQFETLTSGGTLNQKVRTNWESRLFNQIYDKSKPFDRVKYGSLNVVNDPTGIRCCSQYGDSFLLLKQEVRYRTTFAWKDSGSSDVKELACCEYYCHVLCQYTDKELEAVISVALGYELYRSSTALGTYKEAQIHGPIQLNRDIEALFIHSKHKGQKDIEELAHKFCQQNNCNLIWIESIN